MPTADSSHLVECYWPGVDDEKLADAACRIERLTVELGLAADVSAVAAILVPRDETVFYLFRGSAEAVRRISLRAGLPFERILEYRWLDRTADATRRQAKVQGIP